MKKNRKKLSVRVSVRLTQEDADFYEKIAQENNERLSDTLRKRLSQRVSKIELEPRFLKEERLEVIRHLSKIGNNINQIARILNILNLKGELEYKKYIIYLSELYNIQEENRRYLRLFKC